MKFKNILLVSAAASLLFAGAALADDPHITPGTGGNTINGDVTNTANGGNAAASASATGGAGGAGGAGGTAFGGSGGSSTVVNAPVNAPSNTLVNAPTNVVAPVVDPHITVAPTNINAPSLHNDVDVNTNIHTTNVNDLSNRNSNVGINGQSQDLTDKSVHTATSGSASTSSATQSQTTQSVASATTGASTSSANNGGQSNTQVTNYAAQERNPVSTAYAAPLSFSSDTCYASASAGGQGIGFGLSVAFGMKDKACEARANARTLNALGEREAAIQYLASKDPDISRAVTAARTPK